MQIETDPKATSVSNATALGDDEGAINALIKRLQVCGSQSCISPVWWWHRDCILKLVRSRSKPSRKCDIT